MIYSSSSNLCCKCPALLDVIEERPSGEPPPLMEGEGKELRVLGFNHKQRSVFVHVLLRYV